MIDREHDLPITQQAKALGVSRGSIYYLPRPVSAADLAVMRRMDELHLGFPLAGSRMLRDLLNREGIEIGRRHVATLMKRMGMEALYRKPNTSRPAPGHKIYPYLLRGMMIDRPNQVWAMDITYVPMARGFVYLAAVVDWFSRRVLSPGAVLAGVDHPGGGVLRRGAGGRACPAWPARDLQHRSGLAVHQPRLHGRAAPGWDRHQHGWQGLLAGPRAPGGTKGSWRDNVFVERLWRSIKDEEVYLRAYDTVSDARASIGRYLAFYNGRRPHSSLDRQTPDQASFNRLPQSVAA
jgi:putative transposase